MNLNSRIIMEKVTIKAYAARRKLSIFNVVKMTKSGQLPTETVSENGKDVVYILIDKDVENEVAKGIVREEKRRKNLMVYEMKDLKRR